MPKTAQLATVTTTEEIKLEPRVRTKLLTKLKLIATKRAAIKALKAEEEKLVAECEDIRSDIGEQTVQIDGYTVTLVAPTQDKFSKTKFVELGGDLALYNQAFETTPKKSYTLVTTPKEQ